MPLSPAEQDRIRSNIISDIGSFSGLTNGYLDVIKSTPYMSYTIWLWFKSLPKIIQQRMLYFIGSYQMYENNSVPYPYKVGFRFPYSLVSLVNEDTWLTIYLQDAKNDPDNRGLVPLSNIAYYTFIYSASNYVKRWIVRYQNTIYEDNMPIQHKGGSPFSGTSDADLHNWLRDYLLPDAYIDAVNSLEPSDMALIPETERTETAVGDLIVFGKDRFSFSSATHVEIEHNDASYTTMATLKNKLISATASTQSIFDTLYNGSLKGTNFIPYLISNGYAGKEYSYTEHRWIVKTVLPKRISELKAQNFLYHSNTETLLSGVI